MKPHDICDPLPKQEACMRVENCCLTLRNILPEDLYMAVRTEVFRWDAGYPSQNRSQAAYARHARAKG